MKAEKAIRTESNEWLARKLLRGVTARIDARFNGRCEGGREIIVYPKSFIRPKATIYDAETGEVIYKAEPDTIVCGVCNNDLTSELYIPTLIIHDANGHYIWGVICPECALKYHANTRLTLVPDFSKLGKELRAELIKRGWLLRKFEDIIAVQARTNRIHELYEIIHGLLEEG